MGKIKLILLSALLIAILAVVISFLVSMYSFGKGVMEDYHYEYNRYDSIVREWDFTGTMAQSDSRYRYIKLDSIANVYVPLPMTYIPPFFLIKKDSILVLHRSGYPSLYAPLGAQVVKNKGSDSIVIGTQTIDLLP